ncbi:MAG: (2Fe-2S) ferredoxin domain-containing protein [Magnetovibrio sp.]|nr:(2Fe-2S) ferredoxin domain-containing protein [Magnetovibrio sp.]
MKENPKVYICINARAGGVACIGQGAREVFRALHKNAKERGGFVKIERNVCMGYCQEGPNVKIHGGPFYHGVTVEDVDGILDAAEALHKDS